jgi:hypothetical protein
MKTTSLGCAAQADRARNPGLRASSRTFYKTTKKKYRTRYPRFWRRRKNPLRVPCPGFPRVDLQPLSFSSVVCIPTVASSSAQSKPCLRIFPHLSILEEEKRNNKSYEKEGVPSHPIPTGAPFSSHAAPAAAPPFSAPMGCAPAFGPEG